MNPRLALIAPYMDMRRLQAAAGRLRGYMGQAATAMDVPTLRVTAARNLGIVATFETQIGRAFTGSVADYRDLNADQQRALTDEMLRVIRANPDQFTQQQLGVANAQTRPFSQPTALEQQTALDAAAAGAAEGAANAAGFVQNLLVAASSTGGKVLGNLLGDSLGGILIKLGIAALVLGAVYLGWQTYTAKKAIHS